MMALVDWNTLDWLKTVLRGSRKRYVQNDQIITPFISTYLCGILGRQEACRDVVDLRAYQAVGVLSTLRILNLQYERSARTRMLYGYVKLHYRNLGRDAPFKPQAS